MVICQYEEVTLRDFEEHDIPKKVEWINNPENNKFLHYDLPLSVPRTTEWFLKKDNTKRLDCIIEYNGVPVGVIGLLNIDRYNRKAEYYITIGENSYKQKGIATKASRLLIEYAFNNLKMHKIYLTVDARNENAIGLYKKIGFRQEGYFVDDLFHPACSEYIDRVRFSVLETPNRGGVNLYLEIIYQVEEQDISLPSRVLTPIQDLGLYNNCNHLWIKRDDLIPFSFGGNKARKALLFFQQIEKGDYDCVVTYGSSSSNHCRVIANECCRRDMECYIISPKEKYEATFNSRIMRLCGAVITTVPVIEVHNAIEEKLLELKHKGKHPYFIEGGGHGNVGTDAYVNCYQEIIRQEKDLHVHFDYIFFASGTGTTQAGLVCGQIQNLDKRKIVGISIARKNPRGRVVVMDSIKSYLGFMAVDDEVQDKTIFVDDYTSGYNESDDRVQETINIVLKKHGIPLDETYTGKAFMGMEEYIKNEEIKNKNILFIHTGGTPLFFDWVNKQ